MMVIRYAAAVVATLVALSGCVRLTSDTTFHDDSTYSQEVIVAVDPGALSQIPAEGALEGTVTNLPTDPAAVSGMLEDLPAQVRDLARIEEYRSGDLEGFRLTLEDVPVEYFDEVAAVVADVAGGSATVEVSAETYTVTLTPPELPDQEIPTENVGLLGGSIDVAAYYTFPGLVRSTTAGTVDGTTVVLGLEDLISGQPIVMVGGADSEIYWDPIIRWGLIALAALVIVGGGTALVLQDRRHRRRTALPPPVDRSHDVGPGTLGGRPASG